ncbi:MAG: NAD-binding protein [Candidatus Kariarchaeaceae archaeon]
MDIQRVKEAFSSSSLFSTVLLDMPIFQNLIQEYEEKQPFAGLSVAIAHVLVPNTLPLIYSTIIGGANVMLTDTVPSTIDPETLTLIKSAGIPYDPTFQDATSYDYAIDCNAYFVFRPPKKGLVEVTRSGIHTFRDIAPAVTILDVDSTETKKIETFLGNPQAVKQAFHTFIGRPEDLLMDGTVVIIGFGKIGRGLARVFSDFTSVKIMDVSEGAVAKARALGFNAQVVTGDIAANTSFLSGADAIFTATGHHNVITVNFDKPGVTAPYLINVGAVDEFGEHYSEQEVFMSKNKPFNFNLTPPTGNEYIDAILALHVDGLRYLMNRDLSHGIHMVEPDYDRGFVSQFEDHNFPITDLLDRYFS